jgi:hypothetical protein
MTTENLRINSQLNALCAAIDRIKFQAENNGSLKQIARECESVNEFLLAVTSANSNEEIEELVDLRNRI